MISIFAGFAVVLGTALSWLVIGAFLLGEDLVFERQLEEILADHLRRGGAPLGRGGDGAPLQLGPLSELPEDVRRALAGLGGPGEPGDGHHEVEIDGREAHLLIRDDPRSGGRAFALLRLPEDEALERRVRLGLLAGVAGATAVALLLGWGLARRVLSPIERLTGALARRDALDLSTPLAGPREPWSDDEVGLLARTVEDLMERLRVALERERSFIREASHEIRTPITVIRGACELLAEGDPGDGEQLRARVERIDRSVRRLDQTVQSLLWMAREENRLSAVREPVADQLAEMLDELRDLAQPGVDLEASVETPDLGPAAGAMLVVALANLVRNALENTERGVVRVAVGPGRAAVEDSGCGMDEAALRRAREPWSGAGGAGLGLAIVHRICRRFGWLLEVESAPGEGTRVELTWRGEERPGKAARPGVQGVAADQRDSSPDSNPS